MQVIPAIDIRGGRCVRLIQGEYDRELSYDGDPAEIARGFAEAGATLIHVVDLDGAKSGEPQNFDTIAAVAKAAGVPIEVGGGVRTLETARRLLDARVSRVVVGSKLIQDELLAAKFFHELGEAVVAGIDARGGMVAVSGWTKTSEIPATELAQRVERQGAKRIILTDIGRDGMLSGPNLQLLHHVSTAVSIPIIASGGVGTLDHIRELTQASPAPEAVIIGRALYEGSFRIEEALSASKFF